LTAFFKIVNLENCQKETIELEWLPQANRVVLFDKMIWWDPFNWW